MLLKVFDRQTREPDCCHSPVHSQNSILWLTGEEPLWVSILIKIALWSRLSIGSLIFSLRTAGPLVVANSIFRGLFGTAQPLRIEDGNLSDAEQELRNAQQNMQEALNNGASDQELQERMQELREAMKNYMSSMQDQAPARPAKC